MAAEGGAAGNGRPSEGCADEARAGLSHELRPDIYDPPAGAPGGTPAPTLAPEQAA